MDKYTLLNSKKIYNNNFIKQRNIEIDNIKGLFIFFVVFGHLIGNNKSNIVFSITHYLIYSIHMPMFILISGLLNKKKSIIINIKKYLIPYIIFDFLYAIWMFIFRNNSSSLNILIPTYVYWYILCLAIMKIIYSKKREKYILIFSIILSIFFLFVEEKIWRILSIGRVFLLFPVFILGNHINEVAKIKTKKYSLYFLLVGLVIIELTLLKMGLVDYTWATHDYTNEILPLLLKYIYMLFFTPIIFMILRQLLNKENKILCRWGQNSIVIYLLHPYFIDIIHKVLNLIYIPTIFILIFYIIYAIVISFVLSSKFCINSYNKIILFASKIIKN